MRRLFDKRDGYAIEQIIAHVRRILNNADTVEVHFECGTREQEPIGGYKTFAATSGRTLTILINGGAHK